MVCIALWLRHPFLRVLCVLVLRDQQHLIYFSLPNGNNRHFIRLNSVITYPTFHHTHNPMTLTAHPCFAQHKHIVPVSSCGHVMYWGPKTSTDVAKCTACRQCRILLQEFLTAYFADNKSTQCTNHILFNTSTYKPGEVCDERQKWWKLKVEVTGI